ncbi:hypothetical protein [Flavobacterium difficile]|uniref:RteC protein n=1 Tax=Flavobacterium difficile TaxID=2709659 RepID=A0ABX0I8C1_9FLAO|nr:hypothetical protein [Flavobacterium difficile]NHM02405.1 hypothetical protein [Flavobacterium difficile]
MENFIELKKQLTSLEDDLIKLELSTVITGDKKEIESIIKENIFLKSAQVFRASKEESAFWDYCSFSVFNDKYQEMVNVFLMDDNKNQSNEELFIELELSKYKRLLENFEKKNYSNEIKPALEKKIAFLNDKLNPNTFIPPVDYSDTKANEKIVFLYELGVLEFLKNNPPFNTTTNSLASVLSAITGENITTIQPYINPIFNKEIEQDKNPLKSIKLTSKVKKKLSDIGYINKKNNF